MKSELSLGVFAGCEPPFFSNTGPGAPWGIKEEESSNCNRMIWRQYHKDLVGAMWIGVPWVSGACSPDFGHAVSTYGKIQVEFSFQS